MPDKFAFSAGTDFPELQDSLDDEFVLLTRAESALLTVLGFPSDLVEAIQPRHEWFEEALNPNSGVLATAINSSVTSVVLATGHGARFVAGDIVQFDGSRELISVTSIATDTLTVVRAIRSTTGEAVAVGGKLVRINNPAIENETAPAANPTNRVRAANYTEIFRKTASVTRSMRQSRPHGNIADELERQTMNAKKDLIRDLANTVINGRVQASNPQGTTTAARTMDGIVQMILNGTDPAHTNAAGAVLTETLINQVLQDAWSKGGKPNLIAAGPTQKRKLSALMQGRQRFDVEDSLLGAVVERYQSDFGPLDVLEADIFIPSDVILFLDRSKAQVAKLGPGEPFEVAVIGKTSLADTREVVGEFTLQAKNAGDGGHAMLSKLATA